MGRKPTITHMGLLEHAEGIVHREGANGLTIDALAKAAGISKGGVQYYFSSKDDLIRALFERWTDQFDQLLGGLEGLAPADIVRRYIKAMRDSQASMDVKTAGLMLAYIQNPDNLSEPRKWYRAMFKRLEGTNEEAQAARVALLAVEGLFMLRLTGIEENGEWSAFMDEVESVFERLLHR